MLNVPDQVLKIAHAEEGRERAALGIPAAQGHANVKAEDRIINK
jgi:hypothetical protein